MSEISQEVDIQILEKLADGTYKKKNPETKASLVKFLDGTNVEEFKSSIGQIIGDISLDLSELESDIIPTTDELYNIGSPTKRFNSIYAKDLYLDESTLYLGDTPVLGTEMDNIFIQADPHQSITMRTLGSGKSSIISSSGVEMFTDGLNSDIKLTASGDGSRVLIGADNMVQFNSPESLFSGDVAITNTLSVNNLNISGNVSAMGQQFLVDAEVVRVKDNIIEINNGEVGYGVTSGIAGLKVDRGEAPDYLMVFDESTQTFSVGMEGDLEILATRNYVDSNTPTLSWDSILDKPSTFAPSEHTHSWDDLSLDENAIKAIKVDNAVNADKVGGFTVGTNVPANAVFTDTVYTHPSSHPASMITGLHDCATSGVAGSVDWDNVTGKPSTFAPSSHTHTASQVGLGSVQNYGIATQAQAQAGTANNVYMTPLRTMEQHKRMIQFGTANPSASNIPEGGLYFQYE